MPLASVIAYIYFGTTVVLSVCQPPDVSEGGWYVRMQPVYLPGDGIEYFCKEGLLISGPAIRRCQSDGQWSGSTPFCDGPVRVKNPSSNTGYSQDPLLAIDGKTDTCFKSARTTGGNLKWFLDKPAIVTKIRFVLEKGKAKFTLNVSSPTYKTMCTTFERNVEYKQWFAITCQEYPRKVDCIEISDTSPAANVLAICEIEVYVKDEAGCDSAPSIPILNGHLEFNRYKAILRCSEGFIEKVKTQIPCENNSWKSSNMHCEEILCDQLVGGESFARGEWHIVTTNTRKLSVGTERKLLCSAGYVVTGKPDVVNCQGDGKWSNTTATCVEILCDPPVEDNSLTSGEWHTITNPRKLTIGAERKLRCHSGYELTGKPDIVICQNDGKWSNTTAMCIATASDKQFTFKIIAISVGTAVVLIIIVLLAVTICMVQKRGREVVVIYKPEENAYSSASMGETVASSDAELSAYYYEVTHPYPPTTPSGNRTLPRLLTGYSTPLGGTLSNKTLPKFQKGYATPISAPPMNTLITNQQLPSDIAFGTLKHSSLYESVE